MGEWASFTTTSLWRPFGAEHETSLPLLTYELTQNKMPLWLLYHTSRGLVGLLHQWLRVTNGSCLVNGVIHSFQGFPAYTGSGVFFNHQVSWLHAVVMDIRKTAWKLKVVSFRVTRLNKGYQKRSVLLWLKRLELYEFFRAEFITALDNAWIIMLVCDSWEIRVCVLLIFK